MLAAIGIDELPRRLRAHLRVLSAPFAVEQFLRDLGHSYQRVREASLDETQCLRERIASLVEVNAAAGTALCDAPLYEACTRREFDRELEKYRIAVRLRNHASTLSTGCPAIAAVRREAWAMSGSWATQDVRTLTEACERTADWIDVQETLRRERRLLTRLTGDLLSQVCVARTPAYDVHERLFDDDGNRVLGVSWATDDEQVHVTARRIRTVAEQVDANLASGNVEVGAALTAYRELRTDAGRLVDALRVRRQPDLPDDAPQAAVERLGLRYPDDFTAGGIRRAFREKASRLSSRDLADPEYQTLARAYRAVREWVDRQPTVRHHARSGAVA